MQGHWPARRGTFSSIQLLSAFLTPKLHPYCKLTSIQYVAVDRPESSGSDNIAIVL